MAKIKRSTAQAKKGITNNVTGSMKILRFPRKGVIQASAEAIPVKRKNQYKGASKK